MDSKSVILALFSALLLLLAGWFSYRYFKSQAGPSELAFFYDVSEKKLFTADRKQAPPIVGINDKQMDAYRAVVISTNGNVQDKASWKISYLEMYSPELKKQIETAQSGGPPPAMERSSAQGHRFVRRLTDTRWYSMDSAEAERIVNEWLTSGPGGSPAAVCTP